MDIDPHVLEEYFRRIADKYEAGKLDNKHNMGDKADLFQRKQMNVFTLLDCESLNKSISNQKSFQRPWYIR